MINPFFIYSLSFVFVLLIYSLGWSSIYPNLSTKLLIFILITIVISFFIGLINNNTNKKYIKISKIKSISSKLNINIYIVMFIGFIIEFIYTKSIPIFGNIEYNKYEGIHFLHPLLITLNIFLSVYTFNIYIMKKEKKTLLIYIITYIPPILLVSRGLISFIIISSIFIYLGSSMTNKKYFKKNKVIFILLLSLFLFYLFGIVGNVRINMKINKNDLFNNEFVYLMGVPTNKFINSNIPKEYFWSYLYISSPLANLQLLTNYNYIKDIKGFYYGAILPDLLSKRIIGSERLQYYRVVPDRISQLLTVSTCFSSSYFTIGYLGMWLYYFYMILICIFYLKILKYCTKYYMTGIAILCSIILLSCFDNIFEFSSFSFSLLWPIIFMIFTKIKKMRRV